MKLISSLLLVLIFISGCSGTGFEKTTTLMPDRIGLSFGEQKLLPFDAAWRGVIVSFGWDLK